MAEAMTTDRDAWLLAHPPEPEPRTAKRQKAKPREPVIPKRQSNGYYADHVTGDRLRSVTTIMEHGVPKESLLHWYALTAVDSAIDNLPALVQASRSRDALADMRRWLRNAPTRKKEERGDIGTAVHKIVEAHILEQPMPDELLKDPELAPYLANFLRFVREWQVTFTASEMVVANPTCRYAGTLDYTFLSELISAWLRDHGYHAPEGMDLMGDTKTGGTLDRILDYSGHVHGVYPEAGMQMSAYRKAEVCWIKQSGERVPMPATAETGIVLHLRPEGYNIYPARCDDDVFRYFRHAQMIDEWTCVMASAKADRPIIGPALALPTTERKVS